MLKNYLKTSLRDFKINRFYSIINIAGLSLGITAATFILLYVSDEYNYDKHFSEYDNIYRLESDYTVNNTHSMFALTPLPMGPTMQKEMPEIESYARFIKEENAFFLHNDKQFYEKDIYYADSTAPIMFSLEFIEGSASSSLKHPFTIIISKTTSKRYFGKESAYGKKLSSGNGRTYTVTGVFKDLPDNIHMPFDLLMSMDSYAEIIGQNRFNSLDANYFWDINAYTFIKLNQSSQINTVHDKSIAFYNKYMKSIGDMVNGSWVLMTTRLDKIHFTSKLPMDLPTGNFVYVYIMGIVGILILLLASINYTNLATSRANKRAKEIGLRKVVGASRGMLAGQFIAESIFLASASLVISFMLLRTLLPFFNELANKNLSVNFLENPGIYLTVILIALSTGVLSGLYPAFYLSSFQPARVLKGKIKIGRDSALLRKGLVTFQLTITVIMITSTMVIYEQLKFMRNADLGFDKENIMVINIQDTAFFNNRLESFREALLENPGITLTAISNSVPGTEINKRVMMVEKENKMMEYVINNISCDHDYPELLKLEFIKGRNFNKSMGTDQNEAVIINEAAAKALGWGDNAIGKKLNFYMDNPLTAGKVIGVVKDYNYTSLHNPVEPMVLFLTRETSTYLSIKISKDNQSNTINFIKNQWASQGANRPFEFYFLDNNFINKYSLEANLGKVFGTFGVLSIVIALLGLMGLTSYTTAQRTKEIGVRKVLGASTESISSLLMKESLLLALLGCAFAIPTSWFILSKWLNNFAYHVTLSWSYFALSSLITLIICLLTVSFHSIKAAGMNPIISVKYE